MSRLRLWLTLWVACACQFAAADEKDREQEAFFEAKIRPVLVSKCYECHSASSDEAKGGLLLDTREGIRRGGESGQAVVPGDAEESLILSALRHESFEMPPDEQLSESVIADFELWIRLGAADTREGASAPIRSKIDFERAREFWSFQPITDPDLPTVKNERWLRTDIDAFIAAQLEREGIDPVADADGMTLARRIYFDLVGMQPLPEQAEQFAAEYAVNAEAAIGRLVDRLLGSRHFGERWGRHWMDVVRYAESTGMERNGTYPLAWRYRDWVIEALNNDKPYDAFVREQIAGDLLPYADVQQRQANLIATGLLAIGPKSLNEPDAEKFQMDVADEQIDIVTRAFLGLTASCARCHDHKFDPIPQTEYYALAGIFTSTETLYGTGKTNGNRHPGRVLSISGEQSRPVATGDSSSTVKERKTYQTQLANEKKKLANFGKQLQRAKDEDARQKIQALIDEAKIEVQKWTTRLKQVAEPSEQPDPNAILAMAVTDAETIADTRLRIRGESKERGSPVPRGFLTIASLGECPRIPDDQSGRLELSHWITDAHNPLTARVAVNRVWQHLFGRGINATVNNFGANGDRPTHPQLLDHLARKFVREGWSLKRMIRDIMLSRVYRLSSLESAAGLQADPGNRLLWRMNQRRLEAEAIRDAILLASGEMDLEPAQQSPVAKAGDGLVGRNLKAEQFASDDRKRSVYLPIVRGVLPEILRVFDFPEPSIIGGARDVTTVPTQSLYMMNNEFIVDNARRLTARLLEAAALDSAARVRLAYRLTLTREPSAEEIHSAVEYIDQMQRALQSDAQQDQEQSRQVAWSSFCQAIFATSEFRYIN